MKLAIITGASRGIGRAAAERFSEDGWELILNCRRHFELLRELSERLEKRTSCTIIEGEITEELLSKRLGQAALSSAELLLINNAGISLLSLTQDVGEEEYREILDTNLSAPFRLTKALIPYLLRARQGRILNVSSVWGISGASMESVYSLTKGGINAFTKALSKELAPNHIPVNAAVFGAVDTDMNAWLSKEEREELCREIPYGRMADTKEAAEFLRLLSMAPPYMTGQLIAFDGGWI